MQGLANALLTRRVPSNTEQWVPSRSKQSINSFNCSGVKPSLMIWMVFRFMTDLVIVGLCWLTGGTKGGWHVCDHVFSRNGAKPAKAQENLRYARALCAFAREFF